MIVLDDAASWSEALARALRRGVAGLQLARDPLGGGKSGNGGKPTGDGAPAVRRSLPVTPPAGVDKGKEG
jgi:hypothetical protein